VDLTDADLDEMAAAIERNGAGTGPAHPFKSYREIS
jgi:hypothetical protein